MPPPSGMFLICGHVNEDGTGPVSRTVRLYQRSDGSFQYETTSDPGDGYFEFTGVTDGVEYTAYALDDTGVSPDFNAVIMDRVLPVPVAYYWRMINMEPQAGAGLQLAPSELQFFNGREQLDPGLGAGVWTAFVLGSSSGSISNLSDNNNSTFFSIAAVDPGDYFMFDFSTYGEVNFRGIRHKGNPESTSLKSFDVERSDDGSVWTPYASAAGLLYPGDDTLSPLIVP